MTEPDVASSDATNIETEIRRDGEHYVVQWSQVVVVGCRRPAMQDRDCHAQDR
jgi:acyl-CoA dehydrogenase